MMRRLRLAAGTVACTDERPVRRGRVGRPVVLLHGFTGSAASWTAVRAAFRATRRVVAIDLPGHGATVVAAGFDHSLGRTAALVADVLAALRITRADVVGYSMGGRIALQLALAHGDAVGRLVLESASAGLASAPARTRRRAADARLATTIAREGIAAFVRRWEALPLFRSLADQPAAVQATLRRQRLACDPVGLAASLRGLGLGSQPWLGGRLASLAIPVLLVTGAADRKFTRTAARLLPRFPHGRHEVVAAAGHIPHLEQPASFVRALRTFFAGTPESRAAQGE